MPSDETTPTIVRGGRPAASVPPHRTWWREESLDDIEINSPATAGPDVASCASPSMMSTWRDSSLWAAETLLAMNIDEEANIGRQHPLWEDEIIASTRNISNPSLVFTAQSPRRAFFTQSPMNRTHGRPNSMTSIEELLPVHPVAKPMKPASSGVGTDINEKVNLNEVSWSGPNDPENPKNFSKRKKWEILISISLITLLSPLTSSIPAPALPIIAKELKINSDVEKSLCLSIYILGFAIGPLLLGPLSEVYGRVLVLQPSMFFYIICNLGCGFSRNSATLLVLRFLAGVGGSSPLVVGTGIISDCFQPAQRGRAVSIWGLGPLLGPAIGPLISGFIVSGTTWRWLFWSVSIAAALIQFICIFTLPETYAGTILQRRVKLLRKQTRNLALHVANENNKLLLQSLRTALSRPFRMLATQPIIQLIAVYMAYIFGLFYLLLTSFPSVWQETYDESVQIAGLNYLSLGIGYVIGAQFNGYFNDKIYKRLKQRNNGKALPEFRIPLMVLGSMLMPLGLFCYGWTARRSIPWIVPNLGIAVFSAGSVLCLQCMQTYVIDCYTRYAASGIAAAVVLRSIAGFAFPLFAFALYDRLGLGWGTSVLGFACVVIGIPAPVIFWVYGKRLREKSTYAAG